VREALNEILFLGIFNSKTTMKNSLSSSTPTFAAIWMELDTIAISG
jgi:hypothetical protein